MDQEVRDRLVAVSETLADEIRIVERKRMDRDREIFAAYRLGYSMGEIADALGMSKASVALAVKVQAALEKRNE